MTFLRFPLIVLTVILMLSGCRKEDLIPLPGTEPTLPPVAEDVAGFYLLNQGNMGSNKATLDFLDATTGQYHRNIYSAANPSVPKELGDVGNALAIYGERLYAVINCSNKVEVMDGRTARRIGKIDIPNCRHLAFDGGNLYVTSYAGPVQISADYRQRGYVARIDTATMAVTDTVVVGFQPDGIAITGRRAYVANSGGYMVPNYEKTVSVIDLEAMKVVDNIDIAVNLNHVIADHSGCVWISSRGDYYGNRPRLFCFDPSAGKVVAELDLPVGSLWLDGDQLYVVASAWSYLDMADEDVYAIVDTRSRSIVTRNFITDGTDRSIRRPYGVAVNPVTKEIYVTDAMNYVNPGNLHCYTPDGELRWTVRTGDVPACFAFLMR